MFTPVTALYAGLMALLILVLAFRVVQVRRSANIGLGDGGNELLLNRIRIHAHAVEYIPIALLLMLILELNGASRTTLHALGAMLTVGRLAHAQGMTVSSDASQGRVIGNVLSWLVILAAAIAAIGVFAA